MSPSYEGSEPLRFRGTPGSLSASIQEPESTPRRLAIHVELAKTRAWEGGEKFVARATRVESDMVLQMTLPARTPPGTYEGTVEVAGVERPVVIEVEPEVELQIVPDQLTLSGAPGEHLAVDVSIANAGNVAVELRKAYAFGIFAAGGLERALHRTYTEKRAEAERRIDFLFDKLAEEHGGVIRVAVEKGAGDIEPGETREVRLNFHLPSTLQGGRTYTGTLAIHDLRYYVRLIVKEKKETPPGREPR